MKKLLKILGCSRSRSKKLASANEEKETEIGEDGGGKKLENSFNSENQNENNRNQNESSPIENISIEKKETFDDETGFNINENISEDELLISNDSPLICSYEKNQITFTKKGLINLFEELTNLDGWKNYWNKDNCIIDIREKGSTINTEFYLIRTLYVFKKSELKYNKSIDNIIKFIYGANIRKVWDSGLKNVELISGEKYKNFVVDTWAKSPIYLISERDGVEKRFIFKYNNEYYALGTPVPDDYYPEKKNVVRIINYMNFLKLYEDDDNIYFLNLNQADFKMIVPQFVINITLPTTTKNWYINLLKTCNSYKIVGENIEKIPENNSQVEDNKNDNDDDVHEVNIEENSDSSDNKNKKENNNDNDVNEKDDSFEEVKDDIKEEVKQEEIKEEKVKEEEVKQEEIKQKEVKEEDIKQEEVKEEEVKEEEVKEEEVKQKEVKEEEVKQEEVKEEEVKQKEVKEEEVKEEEVKEEEVKEEEVKQE